MRQREAFEPLSTGERCEMEKKVWIKPELISLERGKALESVLTECKYHNLSGDPTTTCYACEQVGCEYCESFVQS